MRYAGRIQKIESNDMPRNNEEHRIQCAIINAADCIPEIRGRLYANPNGGARDVITGAMLKREGVRKGIPDLTLPLSRRGYCGLYIEVKTKTGRLSKEQEDWREYLMDNGYFSTVVRSASEGMRAVMWYLGMFEKQ